MIAHSALISVKAEEAFDDDTNLTSESGKFVLHSVVQATLKQESRSILAKMLQKKSA